MALRHKTQFNKFFTSAFGLDATKPKIAALKTKYEACVAAKVQAILDQYEAFWVIEKPKFVLNYKCSMKCKANVQIREMNTCFEWNFCPPCISRFRYYC